MIPLKRDKAHNCNFEDVMARLNNYIYSFFINGLYCFLVAGFKNKISVSIIRGNNTPPASRQISAPRGVTCLWGTEKSSSVLAEGAI